MKILKRLSIVLVFTFFFSFLLDTRIKAVNIPTIILRNERKENNKVDVTVNLLNNEDISALNIELVYNQSQLKFLGYEKGNALSSLNLKTTNVKTELGFDITPFYFQWWGEENDNSNGLLLTLHFEIKDVTSSGKYPVTFTYNKVADVNYYVGKTLKVKSLFIQATEIENVITPTIDPNDPAEPIDDKENKKKDNTFLICSVAGGVVLLAGLEVVFITLKKKKKK